MQLFVFEENFVCTCTGTLLLLNMCLRSSKARQEDGKWCLSLYLFHQSDAVPPRDVRRGTLENMTVGVFSLPPFRTVALQEQVALNHYYCRWDCTIDACLDCLMLAACSLFWINFVDVRQERCRRSTRSVPCFHHRYQRRSDSTASGDPLFLGLSPPVASATNLLGRSLSCWFQMEIHKDLTENVVPT